jgi:hypothetical protein
MPLFRTTNQIFKKIGEKGGHVETNWMDSILVEDITPPKKDWDYKRELQIKDINIWEVIFERAGLFIPGTEGQDSAEALYAAWDPHAEFYLLRANGKDETFYGAGALRRLGDRMEELNIQYSVNQEYWVPTENMWLYNSNTIQRS